jgi:hypothetical protein
MSNSIYDSIAQDPFLQKAKEELEAIDVQIHAISDKKQKTLEDKVKQDALINKWAKLQTKYNRAINSILESAEA